MTIADKAFVPSYPYVEGPEHGVDSAFAPGTRVLPAGYRVAPEFKALDSDIVFEKDVPVTLRDGVTIFIDIYRPADLDPVPVIVAWSPYGKSGGSSPRTTTLFDLLGLDNAIVSGLEKFEGPDPAYWCARGYAVCNPDARGVAHSEGDSIMLGRQEGQDSYDVIEWLAGQTWCTGRVGMSGTSYLAISQWFTAAEQPPHLAAINPWEGFSDAYRDLVLRGGMPDLGFAERLQHNYMGNGRREDIVTEARQHPLINELWEDKIVRFDQVTVPAYVVASYSNTLHTAGTFRAWRRIASKDKWLRIHNRLEWPDYYDPRNTEDLRTFFDRYLKGVDNDWPTTPPVRYSLLDLEGGDRIQQPATSFPPASVRAVRYYLDAATRGLATTRPVQTSTVAYDAEGDPGLVSFTVRFDEPTALVGYPKVGLWVQADGADDMDLFVEVQKLTRNGSRLEQFTIPNQGAMMHDLTATGASVLRYKGSNGRLRASARHLDESLSTDGVPAHTFDRVEKLAPGQVVPVEIDLFPIGLAFDAGEQLRLVVSAKNALGAIMPGVAAYTPVNHGRHIVHTGGEYASYLQLPVDTGGGAAA